MNVVDNNSQTNNNQQFKDKTITFSRRAALNMQKYTNIHIKKTYDLEEQNWRESKINAVNCSEICVI